MMAIPFTSLDLHVLRVIKEVSVITQAGLAASKDGQLQQVLFGLNLMIQELELKLGQSLQEMVTLQLCGTPGHEAIELHLKLSGIGAKEETGLWATVDSVDSIPTLHQHIEVLLLDSSIDWAAIET